MGNPSMMGSKREEGRSVQDHKKLSEHQSKATRRTTLKRKEERNGTLCYWLMLAAEQTGKILNGYKLLAELATEQPSPVLVVDAFYTEDPPSPIQKKPCAYKDVEDLCFDEREWTQVGIDSLAISRELEYLSPSGGKRIQAYTLPPRAMVSQNGLAQLPRTLMSTRIAMAIDMAGTWVQLKALHKVKQKRCKNNKIHNPRGLKMLMEID
nr:protein longifolia 1-like [Tanacetum cinerariifolium]